MSKWEPLPSFEGRIAAWVAGQDARSHDKTVYDNPYPDNEMTLARLWLDGYCKIEAPTK